MEEPVALQPDSGVVTHPTVPSTPLIIAGKNAPAIMTWGEIASTPVPLPPPTPKSSSYVFIVGSSLFRIPPTPQRELVARKLSATTQPQASRRSQHSAALASSKRAVLMRSPAVRRMLQSQRAKPAEAAKESWYHDTPSSHK